MNNQNIMDIYGPYRLGLFPLSESDSDSNVIKKWVQNPFLSGITFANCLHSVETGHYNGFSKILPDRTRPQRLSLYWILLKCKIYIAVEFLLKKGVKCTPKAAILIILPYFCQFGCTDSGGYYLCIT